MQERPPHESEAKDDRLMRSSLKRTNGGGIIFFDLNGWLPVDSNETLVTPQRTFDRLKRSSLRAFAPYAGLVALRESAFNNGGRLTR